MIADSLPAVIGLVQMGVLELHTWGAKRDGLDRPDRIIMDLDPDPTVPWKFVDRSGTTRQDVAERVGSGVFCEDDRRKRSSCRAAPGRSTNKNPSRNYEARMTLRRDLCTCKPSVYSMNPSFLNLFRKKLTRDRVVPTISASVS